MKKLLLWCLMPALAVMASGCATLTSTVISIQEAG
jgi:hypothetical protein